VPIASRTNLFASATPEIRPMVLRGSLGSAFRLGVPRESGGIRAGGGRCRRRRRRARATSGGGDRRPSPPGDTGAGRSVVHVVVVRGGVCRAESTDPAG